MVVFSSKCRKIGILLLFINLTNWYVRSQNLQLLGASETQDDFSFSFKAQDDLIFSFETQDDLLSFKTQDDDEDEIPIGR